MPHRNIYQSQFSEPGISDILGCLPGSGRLVAIEVKRKEHRQDTQTYKQQLAFLEEMAEAGAIALFAWSVQMVVMRLALEGYEPAIRMAWLNAWAGPEATQRRGHQQGSTGTAGG